MATSLFLSLLSNRISFFLYSYILASSRSVASSRLPDLDSSLSLLLIFQSSSSKTSAFWSIRRISEVRASLCCWSLAPATQFLLGAGWWQLRQVDLASFLSKLLSISSRGFLTLKEPLRLYLWERFSSYSVEIFFLVISQQAGILALSMRVRRESFSSLSWLILRPIWSRMGLMKALGLLFILSIYCRISSFSLLSSLRLRMARSMWSSFLAYSVVNVIQDCSSLKQCSITVIIQYTSFFAQHVHIAGKVHSLLIRENGRQFFLQGHPYFLLRVGCHFVDLEVEELSIFLGGVLQDGEEGILLPVEDYLPACLLGQLPHLPVEVEIGPFLRQTEPVLEDGLLDGFEQVVLGLVAPDTQPEQASLARLPPQVTQHLPCVLSDHQCAVANDPVERLAVKGLLGVHYTQPYPLQLAPLLEGELTVVSRKVLVQITLGELDHTGGEI